MRRALRLGAFVLACAAAAPAFADDEACKPALGHGWPPATENYGTAVEGLLADGIAPELMLTRLPARGNEDALMLARDASGGWTLRYAEADERVMSWTGNGLEMRRELMVDQVPEKLEVPIPAILATRVVDAWRQALTEAVPAGVEAPYNEGDTWLVVIGGDRVSGAAPDCGSARFMAEQLELLIDAADTKASKRDRRWAEVAESLDEMREARARADGGSA
ncbi:hypothetical protein [Marilutibacter maris]|uniref:Uncharacterized protein n=1 Tax=Marilutibacter maris TaxID=1605891 RepID=A0A2U9TG00_9GAMM|nr:hypothetical protein [Lysobacter maris]AWV08559.1 hypothetical protein C9I47_2889 [Lysobacter maris]KAB8192090.1 hypothetical protein FKV24_007555 [Lysobacter maris]